MGLSEVSLSDFALINATWLNNTNDKFKCKSIYELFGKRKDAELIIKTKKLEKGCEKIHDRVKVEIDGIGYRSCLCHESFQHPYFNMFLNLSDNYEKGVLPFSGGILEQPAQIVEILNFIAKLKQEYEIELQKKQNDKNKMKGKNK